MSSINLKTLRQLIKEEFDRHNNITAGNKNNPVGYNSDPYDHDNMAVKEPMYMAGAVLAEEIPPTEMPQVDPVKAQAELNNKIRATEDELKHLKNKVKEAEAALAALKSQPTGMPQI